MKRIAAVAGAALTFVGLAAAGSNPVVRADGRIGGFRIDVTTDAQIRATLGKPAKVESQLLATVTPNGHTLF